MLCKILNFNDPLNTKFIGSINCVIEALLIAKRDKSWNNIVSIGIDPDTFQGSVEFDDSILDKEHPYKFFALVHMNCYYVARVMGPYFENGFFNKDQFMGFLMGYITSADEYKRERDKYDLMVEIAYEFLDYLPFIEEFANEIEPGKRYKRKDIEKKFKQMGYSLPKKS